MSNASNGVLPKRHSNAEQDPNLTVQPLFAVKPLFADGRKRQDSNRSSSGVGLLLHRPVEEVVKVEDIMSAIDDMLRNMALEGYVFPVAQSEVVKTLKEIRSSGRLVRSHKL
jgi:hypothetical protein